MEKELQVIVQAIDEKKGYDILCYEYTQLNPSIDYTIIASASNQRQIFAIANHVVDRAHEAGIAVRRMEGDKDSKWILIDIYSTIVHIFLEEERKIYRLEQLYADLPEVDVCL